jgi:hypothetical protein
MLKAIRDLVLESFLRVWKMDEDVSWVEDLVLEPKSSVGVEKLSIKTISDSSSILHIANHVLHCLPRVRLVQAEALGHVLLTEGEGGLKVREIELICHSES